MVHADQLPVGGDCGSVMCVSAGQIHETNDDRNPLGRLNDTFEAFYVGVYELRLEHQVFRRVTGNR